MKQLVLKTQPDKQGFVLIKEKQFNYLYKILRLKTGDVFKARLLDSSLVDAEICSIQAKKKEMLIKILYLATSVYDAKQSSTLEKSNEVNLPKIILFQWILKGQKMDQVIRQATETGVHTILPVIGEYSQVKSNQLNENKKNRWKQIVIEALQQSGSSIFTEVLEPIPSKEIPSFISQIDNQNLCPLVFTEKTVKTKTLHECLENLPQTTIIAIGAEGGISNEENNLLIKNGFSLVHFNTNILRAETAAIYSISAVQTIMLEKNKWQLKE